jgi:O-antigen/teichoic acid export membrane protein
LRLARGAFWSLAGSVLSRGLNLGVSILLARILTQDAYGAIGVLQGTVGLFATVAGFGLGTAVTKYASEHRSGDPNKVGRLVALALFASAVSGGACTLLLWLSSSALASRFLAAPHLVQEFKASSLLVVLGAINGVQLGALSGLEAFKSIAALNLFAGLSAAPLQFAGAMLGGLPGVVWALVASSFLNVVVTQFALDRSGRNARIRLSWRDCASEGWMLGRFALPVVTISLVTAGATWLCNAFMVNQEHGYAEMALLNAANQWLAIVTFVVGSVQQGIFPALSESLGRRDATASTRIFKAILGMSVVTATPFAILGIATSPWIMSLYGRAFAGSWRVLSLTIVTGWLQCLHIPLNQFLLAAGRVGWFCLSNAVWSLVVVGLSYSLVSYGALGLATSRALAFLVVVAVGGALTSSCLRTLRDATDPLRSTNALDA